MLSDDQGICAWCQLPPKVLMEGIGTFCYKGYQNPCFDERNYYYAVAVARFILCIFFTFYFFWRSDHLSNPDDPLFIHATRGRKESCCFNCSTLTRLARSIGQPAPRRRGWQWRRHDSMLAYLRWKKEAARRQFDNPRWPLLCHCLTRSKKVS